MEKIGFIGLGEMGALMAKNLVKAGYKLFVFDIRKEAAEEFIRLGAKACSSAHEVGQSSDIVFVMARTTEQVESIVLGDNGLLQGCKTGSCIIISATINPISVQKIASLAKEKKVEVLDAPVSGGKEGAEAATLSIMAGGDENTFMKICPVLEKVGKNIFYLGSYGMGEVAKIANNLLLLINMNAACEAIELARNAGLSLDALLQIVKQQGTDFMTVHKMGHLKQALEELEKEWIVMAIEKFATAKEAAAFLGIGESTLSRKIKTYNLLKV